MDARRPLGRAGLRFEDAEDLCARLDKLAATRRPPLARLCAVLARHAASG